MGSKQAYNDAYGFDDEYCASSADITYADLSTSGAYGIDGIEYASASIPTFSPNSLFRNTRTLSSTSKLPTNSS